MRLKDRHFTAARLIYFVPDGTPDYELSKTSDLGDCWVAAEMGSVSSRGRFLVVYLSTQSELIRTAQIHEVGCQVW